MLLKMNRVLVGCVVFVKIIMQKDRSENIKALHIKMIFGKRKQLPRQNNGAEIAVIHKIGLIDYTFGEPSANSFRLVALPLKREDRYK